MADASGNTFCILPLSVAVVSESGRVLFASGAMSRARTTGPLELGDVLPGEVLAATALPEQVKRCIESGRELPPKHVRYRAPGIQRLYRYSIFPLLFPEEKAAAVLVFEDVTDATTLKRTCLGLQELNDKVITNILAAIAVFTTTGHIRLVNEKFAQLVEQDRASCMSMQLADFTGLAAAISLKLGSLADLVPSLRSNAGPVKWQQVPWPARNSASRYCDFTMSLLCTADGEEPEEREEDLLLLVAMDVTDQVKAKMLEARMCETEKLVALGEMTAGLAHTINNPLSVVYGNAQFLCSTFKDIPLERLLPQDWKEIVASLISIEAESERCAGLVASLLQFSHRPQPGAEGERASINRLLTDLLRVYEPQFATTSTHIVKTFDSRALQVAADPDQIQQVFLNLISNARQAMPKGGTIEIITEQKDGWVAVTVRDSGSGIKKDHLKKIFDPFFTTKPLGKGTGLGLPIANAIVTRCGGTIEVESEEGQGTTFVVRLPLAGVEANELPLFAKESLQ